MLGDAPKPSRWGTPPNARSRIIRSAHARPPPKRWQPRRLRGRSPPGTAARARDEPASPCPPRPRTLLRADSLRAHLREVQGARPGAFVLADAGPPSKGRPRERTEAPRGHPGPDLRRGGRAGGREEGGDAAAL